MEKLKMVPPPILEEFKKWLEEANYEKVVQAMDDYNIDVNAKVNEVYNNSILYTLAAGYPDDMQMKLKLMKYLLANGADPNTGAGSSPGFDYSAFRFLIYRAELDAVELLLDYNVRLGWVDRKGGSPFSFMVGCYSELAWKGIAIKGRCLEVIEKFLQKGVNPAFFGEFKNFYVRELASFRKVVLKYHSNLM